MTAKQILGILLLIAGVAAVIYGIYIQNSIDYKIASALGADTSRVAILIVCGVIGAIAGLLLLAIKSNNRQQ